MGLAIETGRLQIATSPHQNELWQHPFEFSDPDNLNNEVRN
jgi:hypothetical protein